MVLSSFHILVHAAISSQKINPHTRYTTQTRGVRTIYHCRGCDIY